MKVTTNGVVTAAREAGVPDSVVDRHIESLVSFALIVARRERRHCQGAIRSWYFNRNKSKPPLFDVLKDLESETL